MLGLLDQIHSDMYKKALDARLNHLKWVYNWKDFMAALADRNICMAPWCGEKEWEEKVKDRSKEESIAAMEEAGETMLTGAAKTLCIPFESTGL